MAVAGGGGGVVSRPAPLAAEAAAVVARWRPVRWPEDDAAAVVPLLGLVRSWVTVAAPRDTRTARRFMRLTAELVVWAQRTLGTTDASTVLASVNVEYWVMVVRVDRSAGWRHVARGCLRTVGRAVNPAGWPPVPSGLELPSTPEPYTPPEEEALRFAACLAGWRHRPRRLWVVACSLGAGLLGPEIVAGVRDDLVDLGNGRVGVVVGGGNARLVPVRAGYTALALRAVSEAAVAGRSEVLLRMSVLGGLITPLFTRCGWPFEAVLAGLADGVASAIGVRRHVGGKASVLAACCRLGRASRVPGRPTHGEELPGGPARICRSAPRRGAVAGPGHRPSVSTWLRRPLLCRGDEGGEPFAGYDKMASSDLVALPFAGTPLRCGPLRAIAGPLWAM